VGPAPAASVGGRAAVGKAGAEGRDREGMHFAQGIGAPDAVLIDQGCFHQSAGRTGLDAFTAPDTGAVAHRVVEIEHHLATMAAIGHANDIVHLNLSTGPDAERAVDAGIEIDRNRGVRIVCRNRFAGGIAANV